MDLSFMIEHIPLYLKASFFTLHLSFYTILFSLIIGLFCSFITYYKVKFLKNIVGAYIQLSRNTPALIQLFFLYYGLPQVGVKLNAYICAVIALSFLGGSYMSEAIRGGLDAVEKIQIESGLSIGLTKLQLMRYIILPQAFSISFSGISANAIFLLKETSIVSAIALADLMFVSKDLIGMYYKTAEAFTLLIIAYLFILIPILSLLSFCERRIRNAQFGS